MTPIQDMKCNYKALSLLDDGKCIFEGNCRRSMVVYELKCLLTGKSYIGKMQRTLKVRTKEHLYNIWRVIESGRTKFGRSNWYGSGGYSKADAFSEHFGNLCRDCNNSN